MAPMTAERGLREGGGGGSGGGRRRHTAARRCAILLTAVISTLVDHSDAGFQTLPHVDDAGAADWTYAVENEVDWMRAPSPHVSASQTPADAASSWRQPDHSAYPRRRRRTELDPDGRFIDSSAWKRRSAYIAAETGAGILKKVGIRMRWPRLIEKPSC